ncbi:hypothetical protein TKK_0015635 [Trichogramma kaykai]
MEIYAYNSASSPPNTDGTLAEKIRKRKSFNRNRISRARVLVILLMRPGKYLDRSVDDEDDEEMDEIEAVKHWYTDNGVLTKKWRRAQ